MLLLLGIGLVVLGLAGGVAHNGWLPNQGTPERIACGIAGAVVFALSFLRDGSGADLKRTANSLGLKIVEPVENISIVGLIDVRGTLDRPVPDGFELHAVRAYPKGGFIPYGHVDVDQEKREWNVREFDIGGHPGESRMIQIWLVGRDGAALLQCWTEADAVRSEMATQLKVLSAMAAPRLKPVAGPTSDMARCVSLHVRRK